MKIIAVEPAPKANDDKLVVEMTRRDFKNMMDGCQRGAEVNKKYQDIEPLVITALHMRDALARAMGKS